MTIRLLDRQEGRTHKGMGMTEAEEKWDGVTGCWEKSGLQRRCRPGQPLASGDVAVRGWGTGKEKARKEEGKKKEEHGKGTNSRGGCWPVTLVYCTDRRPQGRVLAYCKSLLVEKR